MIHLGFSGGGTVLSGVKGTSLHRTEFTMLSIMPVSYLCQTTSSPPISQSWKATFVLETVWKRMEKYLVLLRKKKWHLVLVINLDFSHWVDFNNMFLWTMFSKGNSFPLRIIMNFQKPRLIYLLLPKINQVKNGKILLGHKAVPFPTAGWCSTVYFLVFVLFNNILPVSIWKSLPPNISTKL